MLKLFLSKRLATLGYFSLSPPRTFLPLNTQLCYRNRLVCQTLWQETLQRLELVFLV